MDERGAAASTTNLQALVCVQVGFLLLFLASPAPTTIHAAATPPPHHHLVGDSQGWTLPPGSSGLLNYSSWVHNLTFHVGDTLVFVYQSNLHNVLQVSKDDYDNCNSDTPLSSFVDGNTSITLNKDGVWYFICGFPQHCSGGQKVALTCMGPSTNKHLPTATSSRAPFASISTTFPPPPPPSDTSTYPPPPPPSDTSTPYFSPTPPSTPPPPITISPPPPYAAPSSDPPPYTAPSKPISSTPPPNAPISKTPPPYNSPISSTPPHPPTSSSPPKAPDSSIPSSPCEHDAPPPSPPLSISNPPPPPPPTSPSPSKSHSQAPPTIPTNLFLLRILILTPWMASLLLL